MRDDRERLADILHATVRILEKASAERADLERDENFRSRHPDEVWSEAVGLRNVLVHHYFEIDRDLIWNVVKHDLPTLREVAERVLALES